MDSLLTRLNQRAASMPDVVIYEHYVAGQMTDSLTYGALRSAACGAAQGIRSLAGEGGRVVLTHPPGLDFLVDFFGCLYAGVTAVPAPTPSTPAGLVRLEAIARVARADVLLTSQEGRDELTRLGARASSPFRVEVLPRTHLSHPPPQGAGDGIAVLQFTSGSTGEPKGVAISSNNIAHNLENIRLAYGVPQDPVSERGVLWLPQFHDMGLFGRLECVWAGFPCALMSALEFGRRPAAWLELISGT